MTVKRSGKGARGADRPPARTRFRAAARWLAWRREPIALEPLIELEAVDAEIVVTEIPPPVREWNIWDLERRAREQASDAARDQEWAALLMHLREFANADGVLPLQFDGLVRESFSKLIQAA
jgi:hypothetical protein